MTTSSTPMLLSNETFVTSTTEFPVSSLKVWPWAGVLIFVCSSYIRNLCNVYHGMVQGQTNQMKATPVIYMHVIYSYNSRVDWLASTPFRRKHPVPVSVVNACLETVHAKRLFRTKDVLRLLGSLILTVANVLIIASWLCYAGVQEWT